MTATQPLIYRPHRFRNHVIQVGLALSSGFLCYFSPFLGFQPPESLASSPVSPLSKDKICRVSLAEKIDRTLLSPANQRTRWGLSLYQVRRQHRPEQLYTHQHQHFFLPASTAKLFTTLAAVDQLPADYHIETPIWGLGDGPHLVKLRVIGRGDPSILEPQLVAIAQQLKQQGIQSIDWLEADSSAFSRPHIIPSWEWVDLQTSDGVPITSLSFSQNSLPLQITPQKTGQPLALRWLDGSPWPTLKIKNQSITVSPSETEFIEIERSLSGSQLLIQGQLQAGAPPDTRYVAIADPEAYFLQRFATVLKQEGIRVKRLNLQNFSHPQPKEDWRKVAAVQSPPLQTLLQEVNQNSNNFYTESLLRHLGWRSQAPNLQTSGVTIDQSLKSLQTTLANLGVNPEGYLLKDGSGLSRQNLVSPESLAEVLIAAVKWSQGDSPDQQKYQTFLNSLAIAGNNGTLTRRFQNSPLTGKLFGKTGTLNGTVTLAGLIPSPDQSTIVLSIMANNSNQSIADLRKTIDTIVEIVYQHQSCPNP